ncbi:cobalt-zinc-cadmium efflux system membrane fusion protein [Povalibacter uvarum]|uniref:Cobalt-zinc-cadmium efflux system membrane fusion protein n=1 Tax=Povalibacter uvarum TaxID=732238 RepID=A0A841HQ70_9GAMM|nr:efflux RND transporter periplasmic adaptor subunit [Povalibacter uvarum]MBB6095491.1 cobalt-zinc-cadmium efflux system membrane fusion protein [Povalibacter uvarum]
MKTFLTLAAALLLAACGGSHEEHAHEESAHDHAEEAERGQHGGRVLRDGDFALELAIHEAGVPPEYRVWLYEDGQPAPPSAAAVTVVLTRLDGSVDRFAFAPQDDFLRGNGVVEEPHSFDVEVTAVSSGGGQHVWKFSSYEGRTQIAAATAATMGVVTEEAGPAVLKDEVVLSGTVHADPTRISRVRARYPGVVREIGVQPFSTVSRGAVLAQIQSNESLQNYPLIAPIAGTIVEQQAQIGEATGDVPLFTIVDITRVWVELDVFQRELSRVDEGQPVELFDLDGNALGLGRIARIAPLATHGSQSVRARVVIENTAGQLRPGQFVTGRVTVSQVPVPLAVKRDALQKFRDLEVVFASIGETYEVRMLELGRADGRYVEVTGGLKPGTRYVIGNSYLIKADIEKSGASHDH